MTKGTQFDINTLTSTGKSAIWFCAMNGNLEMIQEILNVFGDECDISLPGKNWESPLGVSMFYMQSLIIYYKCDGFCFIATFLFCILFVTDFFFVLFVFVTLKINEKKSLQAWTQRTRIMVAYK